MTAVFLSIMPTIVSMGNLIPNQKGMTSLEVAEVTGKQHAHVMRDIRNLLSQGASKSNFGLGSYTDANGQERPLFNLSPKDVLFSPLVMMLFCVKKSLTD